jgi:outer membrane receptor protein involved in Fe transport
VCRQRQNLGRTRIRGVEVEAGYRLTPSLDTWVGYLFSDTDVVSAPNQPSLEGNQIAQVPQHEVTVRVEYANPVLLNAAVQVRYVGDQFEDDRNTLTLGDFAVVGLTFSREVLSGFTLFFGIENAFDRTYEVGKTADGLITTGSPFLAHGGVRARL